MRPPPQHCRPAAAARRRWARPAAEWERKRTEQVEAHLLLLLLGLLRFHRRSRSTASRRRSGRSSTTAAAAASAAGRHGGHLGLARREDLNQVLALERTQKRGQLR